jgi:signal transduction histidine kinase
MTTPGTLLTAPGPGTTAPAPAAPQRATGAAAAGAPPPQPRWHRLWGEAWRVGLAVLCGIVFFGSVLMDVDAGVRQENVALLVLDPALGLLCCALLPLRRRLPVTVALATGAATALSVFAAPASVLAVVSLATTRRWVVIAVVGAVWTGSGLLYNMVHPVEPMPGGRLLEAGIGVLIFGLCVWVGAYLGLRRDHVRSLQERAETAEREQTSRAAQARANERARIAREMHDVLAHRMSLVAMHAGALAYRTDLPPEKVAETAAVVQANAHAALQELRDVLGVLRSADGAHAGTADGGGDRPRPERPQPTLRDLDELVVEARAGGGEVHVEQRVDGLDTLPESVSRNAYRIVQEALTNARKHAPWAPVTVGVAGEPGEGLTLTVRNPLRTVGPAPQEAPPSSGLGLVGLTERAELSGGRLAYGAQGGQFVVSAWLPWAP